MTSVPQSSSSLDRRLHTTWRALYTVCYEASLRRCQHLIASTTDPRHLPTCCAIYSACSSRRPSRDRQSRRNAQGSCIRAGLYPKRCRSEASRLLLPPSRRRSEGLDVTRKGAHASNSASPVFATFAVTPRTDVAWVKASPPRRRYAGGPG